ncbi:MAG: hypothetical protein Q7K13_09495 [Polynucleobacter sp.]|uniref:hypothetical protein n=1 Tax=Polynucleobacter sp. TaxID=2029855 RepID=UPI00271BF7C6|nr:hypothetical protein [Polynucleobacter sp.]MDO8714689.1 hypothetical protein [Polynucleobacter sp.]
MNKYEIIAILSKQLSFFGRLNSDEYSQIEGSIDYALNKTANCCSRFSNIPRIFNFNQTQHSAYFLHNLSKTIFDETNNEGLSEKIYLLNRMINSVDMYYKIKLPDYLYVVHGLGTVFSKSKYGEYLVIFQNTTIGVHNGMYPVIGDRVVIYPNCLVAGNTRIGNNCTIGAGSIIINQEIPDNSIVFGNGKKLTIKENKKNAIKNYFLIE